MKIENSKLKIPPLRCPKCGSTDIAEIIYQPVELTAPLIEQIRLRKVVLRQPPSDGQKKQYFCHYCKYEW